MTDIETTEQIVNLQMLEFMYGADGYVTMGTIRERIGNDADAAEWRIKAKEQGWIRDDGRQTHNQTLTASGRSFVETKRRERNDTAARRRTCRDRLLKWVDSNIASTTATVDAPKFFLDPLSYFVGDQFTEDEVDDAKEYLHSKELLRGIGKAWGSSYLRLSITYDGQECVTDFDSDVAAFLAHRDSTPSGTNVHVSGEGHSLALALGQGSNASSSITNVDIEAALTLASAVRQIGPVLGLSDEDLQALDDIEQKNDPSLVKRGLLHLVGFASDSTSGAVGALIGTVAAQLLGIAPA